MTVAHDAGTGNASWTDSPNPFTFTHTPTGTPRGVAVFITTSGETTDMITAVTYGGVAMTRITTAVDTANEPARTYAYFLGASIPTGAQTVSIDWTDPNSRNKWASCVTVTAAADTEVTVFGVDEENQANPSVALDTGSTSSLRYCHIFSGLPNVSDLTLLANMSAIVSVDFTPNVSRTDRQTTASTGSFTVGYTSATDDVAMVAIAIQEAVGAQNLTGSLFTNAPAFFTGVVTLGPAPQTLTGALATLSPSFFTGVVTPGAVTLTGSLYTNSPTFPLGVVQAAGGPQTLTGTLATFTPTFPTGVLSATYTLTGSLFTNVPTFPTGSLQYYTNLLIVELDDEGDPGVDTDHFLRGQARSTAGTGWIRLRLYQSATLIAELEFQPTGTFVTYEYELLTAEAALITDYTDLQIHVDVKAVTHPFTVEIDWVELLRPPPSGANQNLTGTLFTVPASFFTGVVSYEYDLVGIVYTVPVTFFTGTVTGTYALTGSLFSNPASFFVGAVSSGGVTLTGVLFSNPPTFFTGTVTPGTVTLTGVLFTNTPTFPTGVVSGVAGSQTLSGALFVASSTFPTGVVTPGEVTVTGSLYVHTSSFFTGAVDSVYPLTGVLYVNTPSFPTGAVIGDQALTGVLFSNPPQFFVGILGVAGTVSGVLFVNLPQFFVGTISQGAPSFWIPNPAGFTSNPVGFTANPVAYVAVGAPGPSPWGAELSGARFESEPLFPVGSVS